MDLKPPLFLYKTVTQHLRQPFGIKFNIWRLHKFGQKCTGNYTLRFTGNWNDVFNNFDNLNSKKDELDEKYKQYFDDYNNKEKAFLKFVENEIGIEGIHLFKIKNNGIVKEKKLGNNENIESTTCEN